MITILKTLALVLVFTVLASVFVSQPTFAINAFPGCQSNAASTDVCTDVNSEVANNPSGTTDPIITTLKTVINIVSLIIGITAVIMIIVGGLRLILSGGDPQSVSSARNSIIYSIVGVVIAVVAQGIVVFVLDRIK